MLHKDDTLGPSFKKLWSNEKLLDAVEQIVGPNVAGHPVWNLRIKLPRNAPEEVPWHQDNGYFEGICVFAAACINIGYFFEIIFVQCRNYAIFPHHFL